MLVLDANIVIRAVLGRRVRWLLIQYGNKIDFFAPDAALDEARQHLPSVLTKRGVEVAPAMEYLDSLNELIQTVPLDTYYSLRLSATCI